MIKHDQAVDFFLELEKDSTPLNFDQVNIWEIMMLPLLDIFSASFDWHKSRSYTTARQLMAVLSREIVKNYYDKSTTVNEKSEDIPNFKNSEHVLFETAFNSPSAARVVLPVIKEMTDVVPIIGSYRFVYSTDQDNIGIEYVDFLTKQDRLEVKELLQGGSSEILSQARILGKKVRLPHLLVRKWLIANLTRIALSVRAISKLLHNVNIVCAVSTCEINIHGRILAILCKKHNIPSVLLQHGITDVLKYIKPGSVSKIIGVYGELQHEMYAKSGIPDEYLFDVGSPAYEEMSLMQSKNSENETSLRGKMGLSRDDLIVVIALNHFNRADNFEIIDSIYRAVNNVKSRVNIEIVVKLHPGEKAHSYAHIARAHPRIRIASGHDLALVDALTIADILLTLQSNVGIDAIISEVVVAEVNLSNRETIKAFSSYVPQLKSYEEIRRFFQTMLDNSGLKEQMLSRQKKYQLREFGKSLSGSAKRTSDLISASYKRRQDLKF